MPKIKREVREVSEVDQPIEEAKPSPASQDLWDYLDALKDSDFVDGSRRVRDFYIYQIEPPITRREGEPAHAKVFSERFTAENLRAIDPMVIRWKIIEKIIGDQTQRKTWYIAMKPPVAAPAGTLAGAGQRSEASDMLKQATDVIRENMGTQHEAMNQAVGILATAHQRGIEMMPKPGSLAEELTKLKDAGLLKTGDGFDFDKLKSLLEFAIPLLKNAGIFQSHSEKGKLSEVVEILDFVEERFGRIGGKGSASPLFGVLQTLGPSLVRAFDTAMSNVNLMLQIKARQLWVNLAPVATPGPTPAVSSEISQVAADKTAAAAPGSEEPPEPGTVRAEDFIKLRFVELMQEELKEEKPDAENIANWVEMTAPQLAKLITENKEELVLAFLDKDPILSKIGNSPQTATFKKDIIKALQTPVPA